MLMVEEQPQVDASGLADPLRVAVHDLLQPPVLRDLLDSVDRVPSPADKLDNLRRLLVALARDRAALDLRLARLLAWIKIRDLAPLGYGSFTAFCRERVDWRSSWLRALVRLVQTPLPRVKQAVCDGLLSLRVAITAPGQTTAAEEDRWLLRVMVGDDLANADVQHWSDAPRTDVLCGHDADTVRRARDLARLCLGWAAPDGVCDGYILQCWVEDKPGDAVLAQARQSPPVPDLAAPAWPGSDDALGLLDAWQEPRDLHHAMRLLDQLQHLRRVRTAALGLALDRLARTRLWDDLGYSSMADLARRLLDLSPRTVQRYRKLGRQLDLHPDLHQAVVGGLDLDRAQAVADLAWGSASAGPWLDLVGHLGLTQLRELAARCRARTVTQPRQRLRQLVDAAAEVVGDQDVGAVAAASVAGGAVGATGAGTAEERPAATGAGAAPAAPLRVALPLRLRSAAARGQPLWTRAHPRLLEAARWFLDRVQIPAQRGFGRVKERDHWTCQNPECGRRTLRNEAHHVRFRSHGGGDQPDNGLCLCRSCHLRLVHTGRVRVDRRGDCFVWRYPGRIVVVAAPPSSVLD